MSSKFQQYLTLTKPGIVRGNALMAAAGFLFATKHHIDFLTLFGLIIGTSLIIASACVFNNVIDRDIDAKMARTKKRALVVKAINVQHALIYASVLGFVGFGLLIWLTNVVTVLLGAAALVTYVGLYTPLKRTSVHGTLVGSISGAIPPMAGYTAATGQFDGAALLLGLLLVFWQMAHFYAIAIFRYEDYKAAGIPVLPVHDSISAAKRQIVVYIVLFALSICAFEVFGYTGYIFVVVGLALSASWFIKGLRGWNSVADTPWARGMFGWSLVVLMGMIVLLSANTLLP
ncbi:MAG: cyoE [Candidatus Saccharibacteria bacterium]|nr:cyoE [Candidatus Saccharibacteria bacterium]